jgi:hypothetical protein
MMAGKEISVKKYVVRVRAEEQGPGTAVLKAATRNKSTVLAYGGLLAADDGLDRQRDIAFRAAMSKTVGTPST